MSEQPPEGWDTQAAPPTSVEVGDDILAGHLRRRGASTAPRALTSAILARVDETPRERRWRLTLAAWRPRMAVAVSGVTLALLAGLLFFGPPAPRTSTAEGSSTAPVSPTAGASGLTWDPAQRPLTPPELRRVLGAGVPPGTVLIVDDQIVPRAPCVSADGCAIGELANGMDLLVQPPAGGHLPFVNDPAAFSTSIKGPLALQVGAGASLVFLGSVASSGLRMAFKARDLAARSATGGLFVIPAWLSAAGPYPCPSVPTTPPPVPTSELGLPGPKLEPCAPNFLTDSKPPVPGTGLPSDRFDVQAGAYAAFGIAAEGSARQGVYLVRDWPGYGEILARLESLPIPSSDETALTIAPPRTETTIVISVDELVGRVLNGSLAAGTVAVADIPATAVSDRWAPGVVHSCPQLCAMWLLSVGGRSISVVVSMQVPVVRSIVGVQAFLVEVGGSIRALGPAATGAAGVPLDGLGVRDGLSVVHGWLRIGPPLPCPQAPSAPGRGLTHTGILGAPLAWSRCPGTWILPSAEDPWAGPPSKVQATDGSGVIRIGDSSVPPGTLHVQDGNLADLTPKEGVWLVRVAVSSRPCPPGDLCPLIPPWEPPAGAKWYELIGPVTAPDATAPSPSPSQTVLSQERLVAGVLNGAFPTGSIVIARAIHRMPVVRRTGRLPGPPHWAWEFVGPVFVPGP